MPGRIEGDRYYSDTELFRDFNLPPSALRAARENGRLKSIVVPEVPCRGAAPTFSGGPQTLTRGDALQRWLDDGAPTGPTVPGKATMSPSTVRTPRADATNRSRRAALTALENRSDNHMAPDGKGDAVQRFNAAVDEKVRSGLKHDLAVRAVVKQQPELHREYLAVVNVRAGRRRVAADLVRGA